jgi:hypothetical protein
MYEFLELGVKYDDLDKFQKFKADWLEDNNGYTNNTKQTYWGLINTKVHGYEVNKGKDLFDFDKQEIIKLVKYTPAKKPSTKTQLYSAIVKYMEWACGKGYNYVGNPCDTIDTKEMFTANELHTKNVIKN